jgi:CDP-paratose 2-epimerase
MFINKSVPFGSVLIFGGAGFIGSNWAYRLLRNTDANIHIFDNLSRRGVHQNLRWLQNEARDSDRLKITIGDVRDAMMVQKAVQSASEIYHFAAQVAVTSSLEDPRFDFEVNVGGTLNILEAARKSSRHPNVLFTSTNKVYGHLASRPVREARTRYCCDGDEGVDESQPLDFYSPYGCSKGAADQYVRDYCRMFGVSTVVFRMSCIAGARQFGNEDQGWIAHFLYSALQERPVTIYGDGRQVRDVLCVDDLVRALEGVRAHSTKTAGQIYNVGGGAQNSVSLVEIIDAIAELTGKRLRFITQKARPGDQLLYVTNTTKLREHTGWEPRMDVLETLRSIYEWWKENQRIIDPMHRRTEHVANALETIAGAAS